MSSGSSDKLTDVVDGGSAAFARAVGALQKATDTRMSVLRRLVPAQ